MQWYYDRIKDKSSELEKYPGYLPSIVRMAINLSNWYDFLKEKGLYEKTMDQNLLMKIVLLKLMIIQICVLLED